MRVRSGGGWWVRLGVAGAGGWWRSAAGIGLVDVFSERAADQVAGAEADGQGESEDDAAEEDSEGEVDDGAADLEVVEHHGGGEDEDQPLDAEREEAGVLHLQIDRADEHGAGEEARDDGAGDAGSGWRRPSG